MPLIQKKVAIAPIKLIKMKIRILLIILGGFIALSSCDRLNKNDKKEENIVTENFDDFY